MRPIVQRIIDVGSHVNEDLSTEEEIDFYGELVDELYDDVIPLAQEETLELLRYLGEKDRDHAFGINGTLINIVEDNRNPGFPHHDKFLLMPSSAVTIYTKLWTYDENFFLDSSTFSNKVVVADSKELLSKTKSLQNVNEARFIASLVFYIVDERKREMGEKESKQVRSLIEPFASEVDDWADEEKEGLRILGLLNAR